MATINVYHRSTGKISDFCVPSFFSETDIGSDYGEFLHTVKIKINYPADDSVVVSAARELGLPRLSECGEKMSAYEYFSPNLIDSPLDYSDVADLVEYLISMGYDSAQVNDCDVPQSFVVFSRDQIAL